ncbi:hypothetical protein GCM10025788_19220 [Serinicoccus chungangensis]
MKARRTFSLSAAVLALVCATTGAAAAQPPSGSEVALEPSGYPSPGSRVTSLVNTGGLPVTADIASVYGATATADRDRWGDAAVRLPAPASGWSAPRAIMRVRHQAQSGDPLAPGSRDFSFGATFKKDQRSSGTTTDNGDNLIQRGLASDPAQYKIEVDGGRVACRVAGDAGAVTVRSTVPVYWHRWYSAECVRDGSTVTLRVTEHLSGGDRVTSSRSSGSIGSLRWSKTRTPLSVGGKLAADGSVIRSATDQFNGVISDPFLDIRS